MEGYYRVYCFKNFGGEDWVNILLALGHCSGEVIHEANTIITRRIHEKAGRDAATLTQPDPILSVRTRQAMQGAPQRVPGGLQDVPQRRPCLQRSGVGRSFSVSQEAWDHAERSIPSRIAGAPPGGLVCGASHPEVLRGAGSRAGRLSALLRSVPQRQTTTADF